MKEKKGQEQESTGCEADEHHDECEEEEAKEEDEEAEDEEGEEDEKEQHSEKSAGKEQSSPADKQPDGSLDPESSSSSSSSDSSSGTVSTSRGMKRPAATHTAPKAKAGAKSKAKSKAKAACQEATHQPTSPVKATSEEKKPNAANVIPKPPKRNLEDLSVQEARIKRLKSRVRRAQDENPQKQWQPSTSSRAPQSFDPFAEATRMT